MDRLEWDVQEDREALDGASINAVRERHKHYRKPKPPGHFTSLKGRCWTGRGEPEHYFCIRVNEASLKSVLEAEQAPYNDDLRVPYVDLIDVD